MACSFRMDHSLVKLAHRDLLKKLHSCREQFSLQIYMKGMAD